MNGKFEIVWSIVKRDGHFDCAVTATGSPQIFIVSGGARTEALRAGLAEFTASLNVQDPPPAEVVS